MGTTKGSNLKILQLGLQGRLGYRGMHWAEWLPKLQLQMMFTTRLAMIIIHIGGNDLVQMKQRNRNGKIKKDLQNVVSVFSTSNIVWSNILPRAEGHGLESTLDNLKTTDKKRKRINRAGNLTASKLPFGRAIINYDIDTKTKGLFLRDGTHLSPIDNNIFLSLNKRQLHHSLMIETKNYNATKKKKVLFQPPPDFTTGSKVFFSHSSLSAIFDNSLHHSVPVFNSTGHDSC